MQQSLLLQDLRTQSYETYLCCLFLPKAVREQIAALHLAHLEIGRAIDIGEDPMPGFIRLQWWRDELVKTTPSEHLVMRTLQPVFQDKTLDNTVWEQMLNARETVLDAGKVIDHQQYIQQTYGLLLQQAAALTGDDREKSQHAGIAWGAIQVLRSLIQQEKIPPKTVIEPITILAENAFKECIPCTPVMYPAKIAHLYYRKYQKDIQLLAKPISSPRVIWHLTFS